MRRTIGIAISAALSLSGCFFEGSSHRPSFGTLVVDWTVDGSKHPDACRQNGADAIDIVVRTFDGGFVDEFQDPCEDFATSVDLSPGTYTIDAVLLDARGHDLTTAVTDDVNLFSYETTVSAIDFPLDSFL